jgi:hypothetical protein
LIGIDATLSINNLAVIDANAGPPSAAGIRIQPPQFTLPIQQSLPCSGSGGGQSLRHARHAIGRITL